MQEAEEVQRPAPPVQRPVQHTRQMSLGFFPTAPGRPTTLSPLAASGAALLRQPQRLGDSQRCLPIRAA